MHGGQAAGSLRLPGRTAGTSPHGDPLYQLLRSYLHHFLPQPAPGATPVQRHHSAPLQDTVPPPGHGLPSRTRSPLQDTVPPGRCTGRCDRFCRNPLDGLLYATCQADEWPMSGPALFATRLVSYFLHAAVTRSRRGRSSTSRMALCRWGKRECDHVRKPSPHCAGSLSAGGGAAGGDILYSVLAEWWLSDGEEPLPLPMPQPGDGAPPSPPQPAPVPQAVRCAAADGRSSASSGRQSCARLPCVLPSEQSAERSGGPGATRHKRPGTAPGRAGSDAGGVLCMGCCPATVLCSTSRLMSNTSSLLKS